MSDTKEVCGINKFVERDIDMLIAEELRVNPAFGQWLMERFETRSRLVFPARHINVSVVEDGSEADVVATFETKSDLPHRLFVENKIDAVLMPDQLERYVRRAEGEMRRGCISGFSILFFTPSNYFSRTLPAGVQHVSFEQVSHWFQSQPDLRSSYRSSLLVRALPLRSPVARDAHVITADPYIKEWWDQVHAMLSREFPGFFLHKTQYPRSVYFAPEMLGQGKYLRVDFKGHKGEVDLAFKNVSPASLAQTVSALPNVPGHVVANGRSSAIRVSGLQPFVISDGFGIIETSVRAAYQAAHDLLVFWNANRPEFDRLRPDTI